MADLRIQYDEEMVGAGHPTKDDTLNRLVLAEHNQDGTHKNALQGALIGLRLERKDADEVNLYPGAVEIDGGIYTVPATLAKQCSGLSADTWYYLLASAPASGGELAAGDLTASASAPSYDAARLGWYSGSARCLGFFLTDGGGSILGFYTLGNWWVPLQPVYIINGAPSAGWTSVAANVPSFGRLLLSVSADHDSTGTAILEMRPGNSTITSNPLIHVTRGAGASADGAALVTASVAGYVDYRLPNSNTLSLSWNALHLPRGLQAL
ncbi:MAG: hypothetical protein C4525_00680 [Desulfarculus sp.]|nr:MAG: hypothetical protein C4525_00680 [Desulfarculus sp.]